MEYVSRAFADPRSSSLTLGLSVVVITHSSIVLDILPGAWSDTQKKNHAYANLVSVGLIAYGAGLVG